MKTLKKYLFTPLYQFLEQGDISLAMAYLKMLKNEVGIPIDMNSCYLISREGLVLLKKGEISFKEALNVKSETYDHRWYCRGNSQKIRVMTVEDIQKMVERCGKVVDRWTLGYWLSVILLLSKTKYPLMDVMTCFRLLEEWYRVKYPNKNDFYQLIDVESFEEIKNRYSARFFWLMTREIVDIDAPIIYKKEHKMMTLTYEVVYQLAYQQHYQLIKNSKN